MSWWSFRPYVSVAQRQVKAKREVEKLRKKGRTITPVQIAGMAANPDSFSQGSARRCEKKSTVALEGATPTPLMVRGPFDT